MTWLKFNVLIYQDASENPEKCFVHYDTKCSFFFLLNHSPFDYVSKAFVFAVYFGTNLTFRNQIMCQRLQRLSPSLFLRSLHVLPLRQFSPSLFPFELFPVMLCFGVYVFSLVCNGFADKLVSFSGLSSHESPVTQW